MADLSLFGAIPAAAADLPRLAENGGGRTQTKVA
jgi:hypothetical protein